MQQIHLDQISKAIRTGYRSMSLINLLAYPYICGQFRCWMSIIGSSYSAYTIEGGTKWPIFRRRHFQKHFLLNGNCCIFANLAEIFSQGSKYQHAVIGSDDGLTPNRWQAFIWINGDLVYWHIAASHDPNELYDIASNPGIAFCSCTFPIIVTDNYSILYSKIK